MIDPVTLYSGFKKINEHGCNVQVNGSLYAVDDPDAFFTVVWAIFQLPNRLSRSEYVAACLENKVVPLDDAEAIKRFSDGDFDLGTYFSTEQLRSSCGIPYTLHQRRANALKAKQTVGSVSGLAEVAPVKEAELWEDCKCGAQPVFGPLHLCAKCWPN